jgi:hypothetical protein
MTDFRQQGSSDGSEKEWTQIGVQEIVEQVGFQPQQLQPFEITQLGFEEEAEFAPQVRLQGAE